jgi:flagellar basal-body rod protein FlgB
MDPTNIPLFDLAERRMAWTDRRQEVLAQNIANLDTPGWQARDLAPFAAVLSGFTAPVLARTDPAHLAGTQDSAQQLRKALAPMRMPDGNDVSLDEQLTTVADTTTAQQVATQLYKTYMGLFSLALGYGH